MQLGPHNLLEVRTDIQKLVDTDAWSRFGDYGQILKLSPAAIMNDDYVEEGEDGLWCPYTIPGKWQYLHDHQWSVC